ncbi:bifunctional oligoribonuclease/PAP phosphatase NrnA [Mycoplasma sp. ES3157-GEN-MYC]|uniref:Bifunctional oligoribonuclease/PAP phosphatase NrnA n=1 Tax=Mycoplasma miroungigenitalium TaxID=754515 RepID=A0A6M4JAU2_9MOLU|nr:bifunctional oligoribonuclease/PAP phosphatase NrnA [Mycoplasma miroungigenitalium]MBU4690269.1 bifunctional oligoribonuclease/PAP phosphatase NrnA [Mycoplasma miroungigenitalium]MBU4691536.1 bifunctional oligoribonuclease/PAP phosphatase NrnA [Mycoplasma miroungigenitalium]QJR43368.1 bifunctional oligoribonuclease/PAP phosphatase NrnA [Mycoplasma miroungigenitalium]
MENTGTWQDAAKKLEQYDSIVIFHHIRPDGDCLGSQFGLRELLRENYPNKKVYAIGNSSGLFSNFLDLDFDEIPSDEILKKSLGVVVDANQKERIFNREVLDKNLFAETLRIDHHPNEDDLDKVTVWLEENRIAAAEMIAELAFQMKWKITEKAANFVFLGIVTDSGRFQFSDTSARTHELVAHLYKNNLNAEKIFLGLAQTSLEDLKVQSTLMSSLKTKGQVAYIQVDYKTTANLGKKPNDMARPNMIGNIKGYPIWVSFNEEENGMIRCEYRSNGPIVRNVALKWGGGGHDRASGSMISTFDDVEKVIDDCNEEVLRWQKENK